MEVYSEKVIPSCFSITKSMDSQSKVVLTNILKKMEGKDIFLALDRTIDTLQRSMTAVLVVLLDG
uniref:Putative LOC100569856 [Acyrthosiphon pisum] n=1 Tax=Lepeophtheirus salmonis TaxID=72036 RepID=A0A0K2UQR0_LEPSM